MPSWYDKFDYRDQVTNQDDNPTNLMLTCRNLAVGRPTTFGLTAELRILCGPTWVAYKLQRATVLILGGIHQAAGQVTVCVY